MPLRSRLALAFTLGSLAWAAILVAGPYASVRWPGAPVISQASASLYLAGAFLCHQRSDRSFHPWGVRMPVCARCFGLYASAPIGAVVGLAVALPWRDRQRRVRAPAMRLLLLVSALPTAIVWLVEWLGLAQPSATLRSVLAVPLGAAVGWLVCTAILREME